MCASARQEAYEGPDQMADKNRSMDDDALAYHFAAPAGKLEIVATKPMATQRDLSLAYSPGVAAPVRAIAEDPETAFDYTSRGNMVAVISNGTAILGLGNLGALASKPVMEGWVVCTVELCAVNFGLLSRETGTMIRIVHNCSDCKAFATEGRSDVVCDRDVGHAFT